MIDRTLPLAGFLALVLTAAPARAAEGVPDFDITKTCQSAAQANVSDQASQDGCLRSERAAHKEIERRWGEFPASAKSQCEKQFEAGGFPSYVETVTCLELATGTVPAQTNGGDPAPKGAATGRKEGSDLTAEPSAKQRTNPIDVLER